MQGAIFITAAFDLAGALEGTFDRERFDPSEDVGPIGDWAEQETQRQYDALYGRVESPLSTPFTTPLSSRATSPAPHLSDVEEAPNVLLKMPLEPAPPAPSSSPLPLKKKRGRDPSPCALRQLSKPKPPVPPANAQIPNSKKRRDREKSRKHRHGSRAQKGASTSTGRMSASAAIAKHGARSEKLRTDFNTDDMPCASSGYVAMPDKKGRVYSLKELIGMGFALVKWDGRTPTPIVDSGDRVVSVLAGRPSDAGWDRVHQEAFAQLRSSAPRFHFSKPSLSHRRGLFAAVNVGISFGLGQHVPGNLAHPPFRQAELCSLLSSPEFTRIAHFASSAFAAWMPRLHGYYTEKFTSLLTHHQSLRRNFPKSVWAAAAYNFGPRTVTNKHRDCANLPFGICSVTALGQYDHTKGGHLVLWDFKLVVEFPPGSTVLLPSAAVAHSNTPIGESELRGSFAQYTAGGLFRWVDHGFQKDKFFFKGFTQEQMEAIKVENKARGRLGLSLFSTFDELCKLAPRRM